MTIKSASARRGMKMVKSTMTVPSPTPPPPPPPSPPSSASKINRKTMIVLVVIAIIVVAAVVGVLLATRSGGGGGSGGTSVAGASSLQFNADITINATTTYKYTYYAKNIGTSNAMLRIEITFSNYSMIEIVNEAQQQAWMCENGAWTNLTESYSSYWSSLNSTFASTKSELSNWSGSGAYTYTDPTTGYIIRYYDIEVNPSLPDSLFEHS